MLLWTAADTNHLPDSLSTGHNVLGRRPMEVQKGIYGTKALGRKCLKSRRIMNKKTYASLDVFTPLVAHMWRLVNNKNLSDISSGKFRSEKIGSVAHLMKQFPRWFLGGILPLGSILVVHLSDLYCVNAILSKCQSYLFIMELRVEIIISVHTACQSYGAFCTYGFVFVWPHVAKLHRWRAAKWVLSAFGVQVCCLLKIHSLGTRAPGKWRHSTYLDECSDAH